MAALQGRIQASKTPTRLEPLLKAENMPFTSRRIVLSAENAPMAVLPRLASLRTGQSLLLARKDGGKAFTLIQTEEAAIERTEAHDLIKRIMLEERKAKLVEDELAKRRKAATLVYAKRYDTWVASAEASHHAPPAAGASSPSASGPAASQP
jgi:hypothetical protein